MRARWAGFGDAANRAEYEQATEAERALRVVVDAMPGWLYDESGIGAVVDGLNSARADYERAHPDEERIVL